MYSLSSPSGGGGGEMSKECVYCHLKVDCPIGFKPVDSLDIGLVKSYDCEELVRLYLKMVEIGKYVKEEKENGRR